MLDHPHGGISVVIPTWNGLEMLAVVLPSLARQTFGDFSVVVVDDVGLFDEDFFAYAEDLDWGFRAQLAGWACRYVPDAVSYHIGAGTSARAGDLSRYLTFRNSLWLVLKGFPRAALLRHAHRLALFVLGTVAQAIARRETAELRALRDALRGAPRMLRKRRAIQRRRRVGLAQLDAVAPRRVPARRLQPDRAQQRRGRAARRHRPRHRRRRRGQGRRRARRELQGPD